MASKITSLLLSVAFVALLTNFVQVNGSPAIAGNSYDQIGICIENCAQCKKVFGPWFEGELCADTCIKLKGKLIPDCEDIASISPFINKLWLKYGSAN